VRIAQNVEKSFNDMNDPHEHTGTTLVTTTIVCVECQRPWVTKRERWRLMLTCDPVPETVPYCPDCAKREFGPF
jgi:hypothetical protein